MLLINSKKCKIGDKCDEGEKIVKKVNKAIDRDRRESIVVDNFDFKTIFAQNINFFDVKTNVISKENNIVVVIVAENVEKNEIDDVNKVNNKTNANNNVNIENVVENEIGKVAEIVIEVVIESFLVCFVRTCSCNLILLSNFLKYCLQTNVFVFFLLYELFRFVVVVVDMLFRLLAFLLCEFFRFNVVFKIDVFVLLNEFF